MALCQTHFFSETLRKQIAMNVLLPDRSDGPFAAFYLLHGMSDDYTIWHRRTRIEWFVRDLPLIVVMPDGFRGFYTDNDRGPAYGEFFARELPAFVERFFPARRDRAGRCVGGLSMGGYGALRLALAHPDVFASANSHSGALLAGSRPPRDQEFEGIFGRSPIGTQHDLCHLARQLTSTKQRPAVRVDCGLDDALLNDNRAFHACLNEHGIAHEYAEFPGGHDWDYWDEHVREALAFHARTLKLL